MEQLNFDNLKDLLDRPDTILKRVTEKNDALSRRLDEQWLMLEATNDRNSLLSAKNDLLSARMDLAQTVLDEMITSRRDNEVVEELLYLMAILTGKLRPHRSVLGAPHCADLSIAQSNQRV